MPVQVRELRRSAVLLLRLGRSLRRRLTHRLQRTRTAALLPSSLRYPVVAVRAAEPRAVSRDPHLSKPCDRHFPWNVSMRLTALLFLAYFSLTAGSLDDLVVRARYPREPQGTMHFAEALTLS